MVEPLLWRPFGWCRLEVDVAGKQKREGEGAVEGGSSARCSRSASRALALELLARILPGTPIERLRPPRRARWKSPLRYRNLSWGRNDRFVVATSGRLRRVTAWVPLEKVQSLRRVEGPAQRRLRARDDPRRHGGPQRPRVLRDRDRVEADRTFAELVVLARAARAPCLARDADQHAAGHDERAPTTSRGPTPSLAPSTSAERPTPHRLSVATSGETTDTGPWKYASNRQT